MKLNKPIRDRLKVFNKNKILILLTLFQCEDILCGCDLVEKLKIPKNLLSYHIKFLVESGYVSEKKCGKKKNYRIKADRKKDVERILQILGALNNKDENK